MVDAADDVDAKAKIENERARRRTVGRSVTCYGDARRALPLLEHHLRGAAGPLNVGDRVMVDAEYGVDAIANREIADGRRTRIEDHDLDAGPSSRRRPRLRRNTGASGAVGVDRDMPRDRSRELPQVSRGIAQRLGRHGKRVPHRLPGDRYRGVTRRPSLVRDGEPKASDTATKATKALSHIIAPSCSPTPPAIRRQ